MAFHLSRDIRTRKKWSGYPEGDGISRNTRLRSRVPFVRGRLGTGTAREPYLFVYDFDKSDRLAALAKQIAKEKNWKIVSYFHNAYADAWNESGPIEFLQNIAGAEMVLSNSFHATAFSLLFQKDFFTTGREEAINTRMIDLLSDFELTDRYLDGPIEDWQMAKPIDGEKLRERMNHIVEQSERFLRDALTE